MSNEKSFQYAKRMFPLFRAIVKFCSANRLFTYMDLSDFFDFLIDKITKCVLTSDCN